MINYVDVSNTGRYFVLFYEINCMFYVDASKTFIRVPGCLEIVLIKIKQEENEVAMQLYMNALYRCDPLAVKQAVPEFQMPSSFSTTRRQIKYSLLIYIGICVCVCMSMFGQGYDDATDGPEAYKKLNQGLSLIACLYVCIIVVGY